MLNTLPKCYRKDKWVNELYNSSTVELERIEVYNEKNYLNTFFSTLDEDGCANFEYDLGINGDNKTLEERRNAIKSNWLAKNSVSLPLLQQLSNYYFGDYVTLSYTGDAEIIHTARVGFLTRMDENVRNEFEKVYRQIIPAHFIYTWVQDKNRWRDYAKSLVWNGGLDYNWSEWLSRNWGDVAKGADTGKTWAYVGTRTWFEHLNKEIDA